MHLYNVQRVHVQVQRTTYNTSMYRCTCTHYLSCEKYIKINMCTVPYVYVEYTCNVYVCHVCTCLYYCTWACTYLYIIHEGRDEAMASGGVILETKKQPETLLLKYSYSPPENNSSRCHGFIPTFMYIHSYIIHVACSVDLYTCYRVLLLRKKINKCYLYCTHTGTADSILVCSIFKILVIVAEVL